MNQEASRRDVAIVVVTFNRKDLLRECLEGLFRQTFMPSRIYLIDNNSSDGTDAMVRELMADRDDGLIEYIRLDENTGGAGGFSAGLRAARQGGHEWFWLMDDDVEPYPDGLESLLKYEHLGRCIHGQRTEPDGEVMHWGGEFDAKSVRTRDYKFDPFVNGRTVCSVSVGCFEGMLIHRDIVDAIGYPDPELFITWDDTFYGYEASRLTSVLYVKELSLRRKRSLEETRLVTGRNVTKLSAFAMYYYQRNRFIYARKQRVAGWRFWCGSLIELLKMLVKELAPGGERKTVQACFRGFVDGVKLYVR